VTLVAGNHHRCHPYNGAGAARFVDIHRTKCDLTELVLANTRLTLTSGVEVQVSHPVSEEKFGGLRYYAHTWSRDDVTQSEFGR